MAVHVSVANTIAVGMAGQQLSSLMPTFDFLFSQQDVIPKGSFSFQDAILPRVAVAGVQ